MHNQPRRRTFIKYFVILLAVYFGLTLLLYFVAADQMEEVKSQTTTITPTGSDGGLVGTHLLEQKFTVRTDTLEQILLFIGTFGRENNSSFTLTILHEATPLWQKEYSARELKDMSLNAFMLDDPLKGVKGKLLTLQILTVDVPIDQAISFYFGDSVSTGKVEIAVDIQHPLAFNGKELDATLCLSLIGSDLLPVKQLYWPVMLLIAGIFSIVYWIGCHQFVTKQKGMIYKIIGVKRYLFLLQQLVNRDFKTKYKRSVLGVLWSFLNPLLTMSVQYVVFGSLFKSNIENFAIYLMTGVIVYNFFAEAVGLGLTSIVSNASLITKVYVPKYIYPVSRVLSSGINVLISMIPLFIMLVFSGIQPSKSMLLIPIVLFYCMVFCIGMSLILSSMMTFFRDTQFLWGVVSMLWMYLTPIFYPENIIPEEFLTLYHINPLYQFLFFLREITMHGVSPGPFTYLYCTLAAGIPLILGIYVFKKTQDRFVFYL